MTSPSPESQEGRVVFKASLSYMVSLRQACGHNRLHDYQVTEVGVVQAMCARTRRPQAKKEQSSSYGSQDKIFRVWRHLNLTLALDWLPKSKWLSSTTHTPFALYRKDVVTASMLRMVWY